MELHARVCGAHHLTHHRHGDFPWGRWALRLANAHLGLTHRQLPLDHDLRHLDARAFIAEPEQCARMPHADRLAIDQLDHGRGQFEQPHQVGDRDARPADRLGHLLMGQGELIDETPERSRLLGRRQLFALNVLDQCEGKRLLIG